MTAGRDRVISTSEVVRTTIGRIIDLLIEHGGTVHPALVIIEQDGQISVHADATDGELLVEVPVELLVPVQGCRIEAVGDQLCVRAYDETMSPAQRELLDAHLMLYEVTGKVAWARTMLPAVALADHPHDIEVLRRLGPVLRPRGRDAVAEGLLQTRVLRQAPGPGDADPSGVRLVLMPVVDLVNHHPSGRKFSSTDGWLRMRVARPRGGTECFARYSSRLDVIGQMMHYGFVDDSSRLTVSVPLQVSVEGLSVRVAARPTTRTSWLDPPSVRLDGATLVLSHLIFDVDHPSRTEGALSLALRMAIRQLTGTDPGPSDLARRLIAEVAREDAAVVASIRRDLRCRGELRALIDRALDVRDDIVARAAQPPVE